MSRIYNIDNDRAYPSVTTIISEGVPNAWAAPWGAKTTIEYIKANLEAIERGEISLDDNLFNKAKSYHKEISQTARDTGSMVHSAIEDCIKGWIAGGDGCIAERDMNVDAIRAFNAFIHWADDTDFTPLASEQTVYSDRHRYAGTLDVLARINGTVYVLDIKTSKVHDNSHGFQIAAYKKALSEMVKRGIVDLPVPHGIAVLRLDKLTGEPDFKDYTDNYKRFWQWFKLEVSQYYLAKNRRGVKG